MRQMVIQEAYSLLKRDDYAPSTMKTKGITIGILLFIAMLSMLPFPVHAGTPTVSASQPWGCNNQTCTRTLSVTAGDWVVVMAAADANCGDTIQSVSDNAGAHYAVAVATTAACVNIYIYYSTPQPSTTTITLSITTTQNEGNFGRAFSVTPSGPLYLYNVGIGSGTYPTAPSISPGVAFSGNAVAFGFVNAFNGGYLGGATGWTAGRTGPSGGGQEMTEYATTAVIGSPVTFNQSCSSDCGVWGDIGIVLSDQPNTVITITTVAACNFFQLQCWWYPMFFMLTYVSLIVVVARVSQVPERDYTGHFLEALSLSTLIAVMMGMISIMFPLIITAVQVIRALRA